MHLSDPAIGLLPTIAIVGTGVPVAVAVFREGATNIGAFHEAPVPRTRTGRVLLRNAANR
jgi:TPP-dependent pyruvate/acetoin dehydrogenase alpha subunit